MGQVHIMLSRSHLVHMGVRSSHLLRRVRHVRYPEEMRKVEHFAPREDIRDFSNIQYTMSCVQVIDEGKVGIVC